MIKLRSLTWLFCAFPFATTAALVTSAFVTPAQAASYVAVQVEAENYSSKHADWRVFSATRHPEVRPDPDASHHSSASGGAYLELLPDTRVTHGDLLVTGRNFWPNAGSGPSLTYHVNIPEAGRYTVYLKAFSTGSEDNGIHVGLNNSYPGSGQRMQWCDGKNKWTWSSAQRTTTNHCGVKRSIFLDFPYAGANIVTFTAREDGFEFDQFLLLKESNASLRCGPTDNDQIQCNQAVSNGTNNSANSNNSSTTSTGFCSSAAADPDGDGFGWENNQTCRVNQSAQNNGNQNNGEQNTANQGHSNSRLPFCSSSHLDSDGDGYGWENQASCLVGNSGSTNGTPVCTTATSDPDGDGWGWENNQSCRARQ